MNSLKYGSISITTGVQCVSVYVRILQKQSRALRCERLRTCIGGGSAFAATTESIVSASLVCFALPFQPLTFGRCDCADDVLCGPHYELRLLGCSLSHPNTSSNTDGCCRVASTCASPRSFRELCVTSVRVLALAVVVRLLQQPKASYLHHLFCYALPCQPLTFGRYGLR